MAVTATIVPGTVETDGVIVWANVRVESDAEHPVREEGAPAVPVAVEYRASTPRKKDDGTDKTVAEVRLGLFQSARQVRRRERGLLAPKSALAVVGTADIE